MRYTLYGVTQTGGMLLERSSHVSFKQAYEAVMTLNELHYPFFMIVTRQRRNSIALSMDLGRTKERKLLISKCCVEQVVNPVKEADFKLVFHHVLGDMYKDNKPCLC